MSTSVQSDKNQGKGPPRLTPEELRQDRITFALVVAFVAALIALLVWMASVSPTVDPGAYNFWLY